MSSEQSMAKAREVVLSRYGYSAWGDIRSLDGPREADEASFLAASLAQALDAARDAALEEAVHAVCDVRDDYRDGGAAHDILDRAIAEVRSRMRGGSDEQ